MEEGIHIAISAEKIGTIAGFPVTNTLITAWAVIFLLLVFAFILRKKLSLVPGKVQTVMEEMFIYVMNYMEETLESKELALRFFPLIVTIFLFIFTANVLEFTPGIGSIVIERAGEHIPLLRSVNTDLNVTLALAMIVFIIIEIAGVAVLGFLKYTAKFVNVSSVIGFFIGIIELISEVARLVAFSFRLFGNIFAGEVLVLVVASFVPFVLPVPLMAFEVFVGFIQAAIFALLTLFFIKIAITPIESH